jgi:hypothetical protein
MAVVRTDVTNRAPEFASLDPSVIQLAIDDATLQVNRTVFGAKADLATVYLAAHNLSVSYPQYITQVAPVSQESVGEVSRSYAVTPQASSFSAYGATKWGREYLRLVRACVDVAPQVT